MANPEITNSSSATVVIGSTGIAKYRDGVLVATAKVYPRGTILAVDSVSLKYVPFVKGGSTNENGIPKAILGVELDATAGAGDFAVRPLVSATVNKNLLVIDADGDNSNIDLAVIDQLRDYTIIVEDVEELAAYDNQ